MTDRGYDVHDSPLHGRGVFATRWHEAGARIGRFEGKLTRLDGDHVIWVRCDDGLEVGMRGTNGLRFLNHSRQPNAAFRLWVLHSLRRIAPGEEITIDYGEEPSGPT